MTAKQDTHNLQHQIYLMPVPSKWKDRSTTVDCAIQRFYNEHVLKCNGSQCSLALSIPVRFVIKYPSAVWH